MLFTLFNQHYLDLNNKFQVRTRCTGDVVNQLGDPMSYTRNDQTGAHRRVKAIRLPRSYFGPPTRLVANFLNRSRTPDKGNESPAR